MPIIIEILQYLTTEALLMMKNQEIG